MDLTGPKSELTKYDGTDSSDELICSGVVAASRKLFRRPWRFARHGEAGIELSELMPNVAQCVDGICLPRSMHTGCNAHEINIRYFPRWSSCKLGAAQPGVVVVVRGGGTDPEPARLHDVDRRGNSCRWCVQLGTWFSAGSISKHRVATARAQDFESPHTTPPPLLFYRWTRRAKRAAAVRHLPYLNRRVNRQHWH